MFIQKLENYSVEHSSEFSELWHALLTILLFKSLSNFIRNLLVHLFILKAIVNVLSDSRISIKLNFILSKNNLHYHIYFFEHLIFLANVAFKCFKFLDEIKNTIVGSLFEESKFQKVYKGQLVPFLKATLDMEELDT